MRLLAGAYAHLTALSAKRSQIPVENHLDVIDRFNRVISLVQDNYVFRGMPDKEFTLAPSASRFEHTKPRETLLRHEEGMIRNFKKYAVTTPDDFRSRATHWDWLALAQHHRAPTRLLDWSWSPLVALYFSAWHVTPEALAETTATIWCVDPYVAVSSNPDPTFRKLLGSYLSPGFGPYNIHVDKLIQMEREYDSLVSAKSRTKQEPATLYPWHIHDYLHGFDLEGEALLEPTIMFMELPSANPRIVAQSGLFSTMSGIPADMRDVILKRPTVSHPLLKKLPAAFRRSNSTSTLQLSLGDPEVFRHYSMLQEIISDRDHRPLAVEVLLPPSAGSVPIRSSLSSWIAKMRVDDRTMFPDLDGLGDFVNVLYNVSDAERRRAWSST